MSRKELILETEVLAEVSEHPTGRVVDISHVAWESTALVEYPRRWLPGKRRVLIVVTPEGRILKRRIR